jgi:hypothetical protein
MISGCEEMESRYIFTKALDNPGLMDVFMDILSTR